MPERSAAPPAAPWGRAGQRVEEELGLHFAPRQWRDLQRGLGAAAERLGFADARACAERLAAGPLSPHERDVIAGCLTVGESYFFRDPALFRLLATQVLPPLMQARGRTTRHLRLWSAGCSTGEEPYSLAIQLALLLPDWRDWSISILATDVNPAALDKAREGRYSPWSVRETLPIGACAYLRQRADGRYEVDAELRRLVRFGRLNLAQDIFPSAQTHTLAIDVVLCRNVLMYFEAARARAVLQRLGGALADDGWLITGSVELPAGGVPGLAVVHAPGVLAMRRGKAPAVPREVAPPLDASHAAQAVRRTPAPPAAKAPIVLPHEAGRPAAPPLHAATREGSTAPAATADAARSAAQAREWADAGDLARAEAACRDAVAADKLDARWPYLLASIQAERGALEDAVASLRRTLFLEPGHVAARFCLGTLSLRLGRTASGHRHFALALERLQVLDGADVVPGSGGLSVRELQAIIERARETGE